MWSWMITTTRCKPARSDMEPFTLSYWIKNDPLVFGADLRVRHQQTLRGHQYTISAVEMDTERPPLEWFLDKGAKKMEEADRPFATIIQMLRKKLFFSHVYGKLWSFLKITVVWFQSHGVSLPNLHTSTQTSP